MESKEDIDAPNLFQSYKDGHGNEKFHNLRNAELSLMDRFWVCTQIRNDIIGIYNIRLRNNDNRLN